MVAAKEALLQNPELLDELLNDFLVRKRQGSRQNFTEPVDANKMENPNLGRNIPYPKMLFHQKTGAERIVSNREEHEAAGSEWGLTRPAHLTAAAPIEKSAGMDESVDTERLDSLETRVLSIEQMLAEILERLPKKR